MIEFDDEGSELNKPYPPKEATPAYVPPSHSLAVYTVLTVLSQMKNKLGFEAMIEYMDHYRLNMDERNPEVRQAVTEAIRMTGVEKIYRDMMQKKYQA